MSTPMIVLAVILAVFALVLIPLMASQGAGPQDRQHAHQGKRHQKKRKKR